MHRFALALIGLVCAITLLLVCFQAVLFRDEQFAYRDAAHFYYPLYLRIQQEWRAGRWPLWDPWQNGGMPLLGAPMAAVFYPGKVLYALLPYPWAVRAYTVGHVALAFAGMLVLGRSFRLGAAGSALAGLAYAFGAPVLFQYCNIIFLVGAAWVPWGLASIDRLLRHGRRSGLLTLALVLTLQVLGGDPEAAYLTVLCGIGYALVLAARASDWPGWLLGMLRWPGSGPMAILTWIAAVLAVGWALPRAGGTAWLPPRRFVQALLWGTIGAGLLWSWRRRGWGAILGPKLAGLAGASALALVLAAVQIVPTLEFAGRSYRAEDSATMDISYFSVDVYRIAELVWPGFFGRTAPENQSFLQALPPVGNHAIWSPSLYLGGLTVVLALGTMGMRGGPPWRAWLVGVALLGLAASFGRFADPLWWVRWLRVATGVFGPHDPSNFVLRRDAFLSDGTGSPYGIMAALLPGFAMFRYPAKLLTFAAVALASLAGLGWDLLAEGRTRRPARLCARGLAVTLVVLAVTTAARPRIVGVLDDRLVPDGAYGPIDLPAALDGSRCALIHGGVLFALGLGLASWAPRWPRRAAAMALVVMTIDLGAANAGLIFTAPQATFDAPSEVARLIEAAERADPSPGPFRVHRMPLWHPAEFTRRPSPRRFEELVRWERDTLQPFNGLPMGFSYCLTRGVLELFEYLRFFRHQEMAASPEAAEFLGISPGEPVTYYPRRGFDLWNARYFILPVRPDGWKSRERGFAAFLPDTELIAPAPRLIEGPERESWRGREDWQLLRNKAAYPRAWLVHYAQVRKPTADADAIPTPGDERLELMRDLVYADDLFWSDPDRQAYDVRRMAFVETDRPQDLAGYVVRADVSPAESVSITRHDPQRVEIVATLERPGLVVLADVFYPGWTLTIDGRPAPIHRTNRLMRGAAVEAGRHTLVYTYDPASFRIGGATSIAGLIALAALIPWAVRSPR